jgi:peptidoglycan-associated lipoprotein
MGAQGRVGVVNRWTSYREFWFPYNDADVADSDTSKLAEIAAYLKQNPSLDIGIDGTTNSRVDSRDQNLNDRRVQAVRRALVEAGVPDSRIQIGAFGKPELRRDGRIEVLIATVN